MGDVYFIRNSSAQNDFSSNFRWLGKELIFSKIENPCDLNWGSRILQSLRHLNNLCQRVSLDDLNEITSLSDWENLAKIAEVLLLKKMLLYHSEKQHYQANAKIIKKLIRAKREAGQADLLLLNITNPLVTQAMNVRTRVPGHILGLDSDC